LARLQAKASERDREITKQRLDLARWLWNRRWPITGSIAERYLREARAYRGRLPSTLGFLPSWRDHPPALIAAFGMTHEVDRIEHEQRWVAESDQPLPSPDGVLIRAALGRPPPACSTLAIADDAVVGVHIVKLKLDGTDRLRDVDDAKITIGKSFIAPIVLAPPGDSLALTLGEGVEDALTAYDVTGTGAWAAGSAGRMPGLADVLPNTIETVTVLVDDNPAGRAGSAALADRLRRRGMEVLMAGDRS
jgi:hypothetical protein